MKKYFMLFFSACMMLVLFSSCGKEVKQKGKMVTDESGTSHFYPYAVDSGSRYNHLFHTRHGEVKESATSLIFLLRFPKKQDWEVTNEQLFDETEEMREWARGFEIKN